MSGKKPSGSHIGADDDEKDRKMNAEETLRLQLQLQLTKWTEQSSHDTSKMSLEALQLAVLMQETIERNEGCIKGHVDSFNPFGSPSQATQNTVDFRISHKLCIKEGCKHLSNTFGLCKPHAKVVNGWSALEQAFIMDLGNALVSSKRHAKLAALGDAVMQNLYFLIGHQLLAAFHFLDGQDGFRVDAGYAPEQDGEDAKLSNVSDLAGMMGCESAPVLVTKMKGYGFEIPEEERAVICNLYPNGSIPLGWDYSNGLTMVRVSGGSFREHEAPGIGRAEEFNQKRNMKRKDPSQIVRKPSAAGAGSRTRGVNGVCQEILADGTKCGVTKATDRLVTRGRCKLHRTEESHPSCAHPGCGIWKSLRKGGLCKTHGTKCNVQGCTNQPQGKGGMCLAHAKEYTES